MADKGIIFSAAMVRALLKGRKTQTRRLLNPQPTMLTGRGKRIYRDQDWKRSWRDGCDDDLPYAVGDRLYVREAHAIVGAVDPGWILYRASGYDEECERHGFDAPPPESEMRWKPSIHMPRWASRLWLEVTDVRVQRLRSISEADARAESCAGILGPNPDFPDEWDPSPVEEFRDLWDSLHGCEGERWQDNPWIVAISFDVHHGNIDAAPN
ncbi:MAG: hypothetical protein V7686_06825 [Qipengyuania sp.]